MKRNGFSSIVFLALFSILLFPAFAPAGSKGKDKGGPPSHAPAHGYRAKYNYQYYKDANVYYDTTRKLYFYMHGDNWNASVSLPLEIKARLGSYVSIEMDCDKPYLNP